MTNRTWTNGGGIPLSATNLNALETDIQKGIDAADRVPVGEPDELRVVDTTGAIAFKVDETGIIHAGRDKVRPSEGFRIVDASGNISVEIDKISGRVTIYDAVFPNGGAGGSTTFASSPITALHVFLAVGQSNMSGRGLPSGGTLDPADARIFQFGATTRAVVPATVPLDMHDTATGLSPATTFAREYLRTQPANVGVLLIPAAHGGTAFTTSTTVETWTPNTATNPAYDLPALAVAQFNEALTGAKALGYTVVAKGILWHQGESNGAMSTTTYASNLDALISYFRTQLGDATLPFVVGQMVPEGITANTGRDNVDKAHAATPSRVVRTGFGKATTNGYNAGDTTHFSRVGIEFLGRTMHAAYWQAVANVTGAAPLAPANIKITRPAGGVKVEWDAPPRGMSGVPVFSLDAGAGTEYFVSESRITGYRLEYAINGGTRTTYTRSWTMFTTELMTGLAAGTVGVWVTALGEGGLESTSTYAVES